MKSLARRRFESGGGKSGPLAGALLVLVGSLALPGCVNQNTWRPTVDPYSDPRAATLSRDEAECRQIAKNSAGSEVGETAKGAAVGGGLGAGAGAIFGAMAGNAGLGAAAGAAAGGMAGGTYKSVQTTKQFKQVFSNCMRERGHKVLD